MISSKTLYLTADRDKVVEEGNPKARFLLVREGHEIDDKLAEKHGVNAQKASKQPDVAPAAEPQATAPAKRSRK